MGNEKNFQVHMTGPIEVNSVLIALGDTLYIIDPGGEEEVIIREAKKSPCKNRVILLTHAHADHIAAVPGIAKELGIQKIYLHPADQEIYNSPANSVGTYIPHPDNLPETCWPLNEPRIRVLECPGHTPGGVAYVVPELNTVFAGDTIFYQSVGRTDLPGGSYEKLLNSIRTQIYTLPDDTVIVSGHGPNTSVGFEKQTNPYTNV